MRVADDGSRVLFLRSAAGDDPVNALWCLDPTTGVERLVADPRDPDLAGPEGDGVPAAELARRERVRESGSGIVAFDALADCSRACFVLDGRVYLAEVMGPDGTPGGGPDRVVELPSTGAAFDPRLSPDGTEVAYVSGPSLRLTGAGGDRRVIGGASPTVSWGSADFLAAEEMGRNRGHWWTPDGRRLLVNRVDTAPVAEWWISSPVDPGAPPRPVRYPAVGTDNATVGLSLVDPWADDPAGVAVTVDWSDGGTYEYLVDVGWPTDGWPMVVAQTRDHRTLAVLEVDPSTGVVTERHRITDGHWVDLFAGSPLQVGGRLLTIEPHEGDNRLLCDGMALSPDGMQVRAILGVDRGPDGERVLVQASTDPVDVEVVGIRLFPEGPLDGASAGSGSGTGSGSGADWELVSGGGGVRSAAVGGGLTVVSVADLTGSAATVLPAGHVLASHAEAPLVHAAPDFHVVGDRDLRAAVLVPDGHDGAPLPVLLDPYGGPQHQRVRRVRGEFLTSQWFADRGFAVVVVDGRGTPGRGPAWDRAVWGDLAGPVLDDQVDGLQALAATDERLDLSRVAMRGWSFGGFLSALAVLRRPDVFHAAVAGAPVTDWHLYDSYYTERYLGHPATEPDNYARSGLCDPAGWAPRGDGGHSDRPLLMVHGLADDNVVVAHTLALSRVLLEAGRPHSVLPLSGVTHMTPQVVVAENLLRLQLDFLADSLGMVPRPEQASSAVG